MRTFVLSALVLGNAGAEEHKTEPTARIGSCPYSGDHALFNVGGPLDCTTNNPTKPRCENAPNAEPANAGCCAWIDGACRTPVAKKTHYEIKSISKAYQMGKFPYLYGGGSLNIQPDEQACMAQCEKRPECKYGTFVTAALKVDGTHAFSHQARFGECWLSATTHEKPVACGVPCKGFQKVEVDDKPDLPEEPPNVEQTNECTCNARDPSDVYMACMTRCIDHGMHTYVRSACKCNPNTDTSVFTTCRQDAFSYHIKVHHLQPRFHTEPISGGEQHRCMMVAKDNCKCCDCHGTSFYHIREIGFGMHTAAAPFLTEDPPVVRDMHECQEHCHAKARCRAGTFITDGPSKGECWLSHNLVSSEKCVKPCASFIKIEPETPASWESPNPDRPGPDHGSRKISPVSYQQTVDKDHVSNVDRGMFHHAKSYRMGDQNGNEVEYKAHDGTVQNVGHEDKLRRHEDEGNAKDAADSKGTKGEVALEVRSDDPSADVSRAQKEFERHD